MELQIGSTFQNRYDILEYIGQGAMGCVYKVRDRQRDGLICALKILQDGQLSHPKYKKRFTEEMRVMQKLKHPHVVRIFDSHLSSDPLH